MRCRHCDSITLIAMALLVVTLAVVLATAESAAGDDWPNGASWPAWTMANDTAEVRPLSDQAARQWTRWLIPLPKRIQWIGKLALPASGVNVRLRTEATEVEQTARDELVALIGKKAGAGQLAGPFTILIGVCDAQGMIDGVAVPGAEKLRGLKNDDQAYVIAPLASKGLAVAALTERGVYHGVKTLGQMLEAGSDKGMLTLPIVAVLDWPDLAERGQWTFEEKAPGDIQYMADRKMNLLEVRTPAGFDDKGRGTLDVNVEGMREARRRAVNWLPFIAHLANQAYRTDIYRLYPETQGRGPRARHARVPNDASADIVVPCASNSQFIQVVAEWLMSAAEKGATEVNVFLSELEGMGCDCEQCKGKSQFALEAKACVRAWRIAQDKYPKLRLRILLSQGSYDTNDQVLAAVPETEVGISYYSGSSRGKIPGYAPSTYTASQDPLIYPLLADFVKQGRWLGCYPTVTATYRVATPWCGPQFMKFRMTEFMDKGLASVSGYIPPDKRFFDFNFTAMAEWSWNAHGRTEHEFAAAWATRRGLADPDKAADWAVMLGPVGWDVYGSNAPTSFLGRTAAMVERRQKPQLGAGMFLYYPTVERMDDDLAVCRQALELARQVDDPALIAETCVIEGYVRMIKSIYLIADSVAGRKELDDAQTASVQAAVDELRSAARQTVEALRAWNRAVAADYDLGDPGERGGVAHHDVAGYIVKTVADVGVSLAPLGIRGE